MSPCGESKRIATWPKSTNAFGAFTYHAGTKGRARTNKNADDSTRRRTAADALRSSRIERRAPARTSGDTENDGYKSGSLSAPLDASRGGESAPFAAVAVDHIRQAIELFERELRAVDEGGYGVFDRACEEGLHEVRERAFSCVDASDGGGKDVSLATLRVLHVPSLLEQSEQGAYCGISGRFGEIFEDLVRGRPPTPVEDIDDFALAARENCLCRRGRG